MILWRIHTEYKQIDLVINLATILPRPGATFLKGTGLWQGQQEEALVIEIIGEAQDEAQIRRFASLIKKVNKQDTILITSHHCESYIAL
jgi:hypothetical protein